MVSHFPNPWEKIAAGDTLCELQMTTMNDSADARNSLPLGRWPLLVILLSWVTFCSCTAVLYSGKGENGAEAIFASLAAGGLIAGMAILRRPIRWQNKVRQRLLDYTHAIDELSISRLGLWTALAAGLGIYLELVLIRFHGSCFQVFAFFKNFSLLSCFLGLGVGYVLNRARPLYLPLTLPLLAVQVIFLHLLRFTSIGDELHNPIPEYMALGVRNTPTLASALMVYALLLWVFSYNAACFIGLGQVASRLMDRLPKLTAYSWNLAGSLAGILLFYILSFFWTPPVVWFAAGFIALLLLLKIRRFGAICVSLVVLGVLSLSFDPAEYDLYSPYQILTVHPGGPDGVVVEVNHAFYQRIHDLGPSAPDDEITQSNRAYYNSPYVFQPNAQDVLIVGSGTGNDVAAAVRNHAGHVDAVEIDPVILELGRRLHPEKPYDSPTVTAHLQDARAFIRYTQNRYDLIIFGLLDSHTMLSGVSGVRLDSYVYTVDALREARALLKEDGVIFMSFSLLNQQMNRKMDLMLTEAFDGAEPLCYQSHIGGAAIFIAGKHVREHDYAPPAGVRPAAVLDVPADPSTDDWPFFYMPVRKYPSSYLIVIPMLLLAAWLFIAPAMRGSQGGFSAPCFLLGAGFMLLETKAITELALFYGSTWVVIAVVIAAILTMAFLANLAVMHLPALPRTVSYILLLASLALSLWFASISHADYGQSAARLIATAIITLPLFFSGLVFSSELKSAPSIASAMGSNLIGAMVGGCLEYNSMYFGYRSLYLLALVIYALSLIVSLKRSQMAAANLA
jgi:hypothetical protein